MLARDPRPLAALERSWPAPAVAFSGAFSPAECARIQAAAAEQEMAPAAVGTTRRNEAQTRRSDIGWIHHGEGTAWIYDRLASYAELANAARFGFDLVGFEGALQYGEYGPGHFFDWHQDFGAGDTSLRKLSAVCLLSDPSDYEGGRLELPRSAARVVPEAAAALDEARQGTLCLFPSYQLPRVPPVSAGVRRSLGAWIAGPPLR